MELIDYLKEDHDAIRLLIHEIDMDGDMGRKKRIFTELNVLLRAHFRAEELVLYSKSLKIKDPEIDKIALDIYEEHRFLEDFIYKIQSSENEEIWKTRVRIFFQILEINLDTKEGGYFVELRKRFSALQLAQAAVLYLKAKKFEEAQGLQHFASEKQLNFT